MKKNKENVIKNKENEKLCEKNYERKENFWRKEQFWKNKRFLEKGKILKNWKKIMWKKLHDHTEVWDF